MCRQGVAPPQQLWSYALNGIVLLWSKNINALSLFFNHYILFNSTSIMFYKVKKVCNFSLYSQYLEHPSVSAFISPCSQGKLLWLSLRVAFDCVYKHKHWETFRSLFRAMSHSLNKSSQLCPKAHDIPWFFLEFRHYTILPCHQAGPSLYTGTKVLLRDKLHPLPLSLSCSSEEKSKHFAHPVPSTLVSINYAHKCVCIVYLSSATVWSHPPRSLMCSSFTMRPARVPLMLWIITLFWQDFQYWTWISSYGTGLKSNYIVLYYLFHNQFTIVPVITSFVTG